MVTIEVEWALWSERQGARDDYAVLSCSDGKLRAAHFKKIITRFSPGTADTERALPRVTISVVDIAHRPHIGVAIQNRSEHYDGTGRRIAPTRFFCFPYESLDRQPVSYHGLYEALSAITLPDTGEGPPKRVNVPLLDAAAIAASLPNAGTTSVLAAGAYLLRRGRVCVTQAEHATPEERLRYLDAVAALLPYGYRSKVTATTWANGATRHSLRLYFSRHAPDDDALVLPWQQVTTSPFVTGYARHLEQLLETHGPTDVIALLAAETGARNFDDPDDASATLDRIETRLGRGRLLREGRSTLAYLRKWLSFGGPGGEDSGEVDLGDEEARIILREFIPRAQGRDLDRVVHWLSKVAAHDLSPWWNDLVAMGARLLWAEGARLQDLLRIIGDVGSRDRFLAELIRARPAPRAEFRRGLSSAAQLLAAYAVTDPGDHPRTGEALANDVPLTIALINELIARDDEGQPLPDGYTWALNKLPPTVAPLVERLVDRSEHLFDSDEIATLASFDDSCVLRALDIAVCTRKMNLVVDAFVNWVISNKGFQPGEESYWGDGLSALDPDDSGMLAIIDVMLLTIGRRPQSMTRVANEGWTRYRECFLFYWKAVWPDRSRMILELAKQLRAQSWHDVPGRADAVLEILMSLRLTQDTIIANAMVESLSQATDLSRDPRASAWLPPVPGRAVPAQESPDFRGGSAERHEPATQLLPAASSAEHPKAPEQAFGFIVSAFRDGLEPAEAYREVIAQVMIPDVPAAVEMVEHLPYRIAAFGSLNEGFHWSHALIRFLCAGNHGEIFAAEFKRAYMDKRLARMSDDIRFLREFNENAGYMLNEKENAKRVKSVADLLQGLTSEKEKSPKRGILGRGKKAPPEQQQATRSLEPGGSPADEAGRDSTARA